MDIPNNFGRVAQHRLTLGPGWPRPTVEERKGISIVELSRAGVFGKFLGEAQDGFFYGDLRLALVHDQTSLEWYFKILNYGPKNSSNAIDLAKTPCQYGGYRWWLLCPKCGKRQTVLYEHNDDYACRFCLKLRYDTQRLNYKSVEPALVKLQKTRAIRARDLIRYRTYAGKTTKRVKKQWKLIEETRALMGFYDKKYRKALRKEPPNPNNP